MVIVPINKKTIELAIKILKNGGSVIFPTETAYGLAVDATNKKAIQKVFKIKQRPIEKSLSWIVASVAMAKKYVKFSPPALKLAKKYWPGPLTIVLPSRRGRGTRALRISSNKIAHALSRYLGRPIVSTSANLSGLPACYSATAAARQFKKQKFQPDIILNAGRLPKRAPSNIIKIEGKKIITLRHGAIRL